MLLRVEEVTSRDVGEALAQRDEAIEAAGRHRAHAIDRVESGERLESEIVTPSDQDRVLARQASADQGVRCEAAGRRSVVLLGVVADLPLLLQLYEPRVEQLEHVVTHPRGMLAEGRADMSDGPRAQQEHAQDVEAAAGRRGTRVVLGSSDASKPWSPP